MAYRYLYVQSYGFLWFLSTVYLVHATATGFKRPTDAVFHLIVRRPRIAGGNLTIPLESSVRLVKCSHHESTHNTIRLRYGKSRQCLVMRASDSLEHEKWLVGFIQPIAAAQNLNDHVPILAVLHTSLEITPETATQQQLIELVQPETTDQSLTQSSLDTVSSSVDRLDIYHIPVFPRRSSSSASAALRSTWSN